MRINSTRLAYFHQDKRDYTTTVAGYDEPIHLSSTEKPNEVITQ